MKKFLKPTIAVLIALVISVMFVSCTSKETKDLEQVKQEIEQLQKEKVLLEKEVKALEDKKAGLKPENDVKYVLVLKISQSHFTFDLTEHLKDATNDIEIPIEVSEDYYNSVEKGEELSSDFRWGSFVFKGSLGSWKVKVEDKQIVTAEDNN